MSRKLLESDSSIFAEQTDFSFKKWLRRMLQMWAWFLLSLIFFLGLAFVYLNIANPTYDLVSSVMIKDEKKGGELMDNSVMKEMGLGGDNKLVENEIEVFKSYDLMETVVRRLNLYISTSHKERFRDVVVFQNQVPFTVQILNPGTITDEISWSIQPYDSGFVFKTKDSTSSRTLQYNEVNSSGGIVFRCVTNKNYVADAALIDTSKNYNTWKLKLAPINDVTLAYWKKLNVEAVSKLATVLTIELKDKNEQRGNAILRTMIGVYNQQSLDDKNRVTDSTIKFLNVRLQDVSNELKGAENNVAKYKSSNKVTDLTVDAQQYLTLAQQIDVQKAQSETQLNIVNALESELEKNQDNPHLVPSTLGLQEPALALLVERHNELILQKERIEEKSGPQNPLLVDLNGQIKEVRSKLLYNVRSLKQAYSISMNDVSARDAQLTSQIHNMPVLEKDLIQITRDKTVQEQVYAFLLQKREEAAVTLASNVEDSRTILQPRSVGILWPNVIVIWAAAALLGLIFPAGIFILRDYMNNKVGDSEQVEQNINLPILGSISHVKKSNFPIVIKPHSRSIGAEQIRNIRTAIGYTNVSKEVKSVLVTSFQPGDGKSFVSLNLAASYALLNKKTVILEFDLRKPQISKHLGLTGKEGLSSILSGKSSVENLLIEIEGYDQCLYLLPAGYLPPNPAELISGQRMACLIETLSQQFDYIIMDTPPFSIVSDANLLQRYADISLIVLRQDHTSRDVYPVLKNYLARNPDYPVYLLLNGVGKRKRYQQAYTKYGSGYYLES